MGIGTLGFLKGASSTWKDSLDKREEAEREIAKIKMIEKLRREDEKIVHDRNVEEADSRIDEKLTKVDYDTGVRTYYNHKGVEIKKDTLTAAELAAYKRNVEKETLDNTGKRLSNRHTEQSITLAANADRRADRQQNLYAKSLDRTTSNSDVDDAGDDEYTIGQEILSMRKGLVDSAKARGIDPALIDEAAASAVREAVTNPANKTAAQRQRAATAKLEARLRALMSAPPSLDRQYKVSPQQDF